MRIQLIATVLVAGSAFSNRAFADDLGMRGFGDLVLFTQFLAAFFLLQFIACSAIAVRRIHSRKRLSGALYLLVPVETAAISLIVYYSIPSFAPGGSTGSIFVAALTPAVAWLVAHFAWHRAKAANA
jgi:ABC-type Co2+ transport system permease subunit